MSSSSARRRRFSVRPPRRRRDRRDESDRGFNRERRVHPDPLAVRASPASWTFSGMAAHRPDGALNSAYGLVRITVGPWACGPLIPVAMRAPLLDLLELGLGDRALILSG